jgi:hypothetical protein
MSFRARLITSGALGGLSGVVIAVGMLAMLAMPARAQPANASHLGWSGRPTLSVMQGDSGTNLIALEARPAASALSSTEA